VILFNFEIANNPQKVCGQKSEKLSFYVGNAGVESIHRISEGPQGFCGLIFGIRICIGRRHLIESARVV
jgi:hypothetical protein